MGTISTRKKVIFARYENFQDPASKAKRTARAKRLRLKARKAMRELLSDENANLEAGTNTKPTRHQPERSLRGRSGGSEPRRTQ